MMILKLGFVFFMLFCITACSQKHFYTVRDDATVLYYHNADAKEVLFASSIDHFALHPAIATDDRLWEISVPLHEEFAYFYIVDGAITLPGCTLKQQDDFGSQNCLYVKGM